MKALLILFLFSLLLTSAAFLECETCFAISSNCTGGWETCEADQDTCAIERKEESQGGKTEQTVEKGCHSSDTCTPGWRLVTFGKGEFIGKSTNCCTGEDCSSAFSHLPPINTTANGKQCPACYSSSKRCSGAVVNCTGSDDYCLDLVGYRSYTEKKIYLKGCTMESMCLGIQNGTWNIVDADNKEVDCRPAGQGSLPSGSLFSSIFGFLLLMVLS